MMLYFLLLSALVGISSAAAPGFANGVTGGTGGATVYPTTLAQLRSYLCGSTDSRGYCTDNTARNIILNRSFDFRDSMGKTTERGCFHRNCNGKPGPSQVGLNFDNYCNGRTATSVTYDKAGRSGTILVGSNKTLLGSGNKGAIRGAGLMIKGGVSNIIIRNIAITDINPDVVWGGDGIDIDNSSRIWIDHCYFARIGRQMIAIGTKAVQWVTISFNEFDGKTGASATCDHRHYWVLLVLGAQDTVTIYGNYFHNSSGRGPQIGGSGTQHVHVVNNYFENLSSAGSLTAKVGASVLLEGNYYQTVTHPVYSSTTGGAIFGSYSDAGTCASYLGRNCIGNRAAKCNTNYMPANIAVLNVFKNYKKYLVNPMHGINVPSWVLANAGVGKL
ncbi:probable pectin lyase B [Cephus cinctus]|uniref:pectin lyase n=1 Tax=Cephus cinctus TaxID=211228 RepID=A0AAJ7BZE2_CEPCN|nr:probable pectin lyase B [Cephus cinctus]